MAVSIRDVAAQAGVGVGTVSRVLNDSPGVSPATRNRVREAIDELSYRPNLRARALSTGRTSSIGAVVPFFTHPSAVERLRGVVEGLEASGYDVVLFNVGSVQQRARRFSALGAVERADGVLLVSLRPTDAEVADFAAAEVPLVLIDTEHPALSQVRTDDVEGGRLATEHLLALGHERIAFVGELPDPVHRFMAARRRLVGYRQAMAGRTEAVRLGIHSQESARRWAAELLALPDPPTAIFAASDTHALGVLEAAAADGLDVPGDLSVIGFDDIDVAAHLGLSTVRQPLRESGLRGAQLVLRALETPEAPPVEVVLPLEVIARRTTAAI